MSRYALGLEFGSDAARAVLAGTGDGREAGAATLRYPRGLLATSFEGVELRRDSALQDPRDYLEVLRSTIPELLRQTGVDPAEIAGIGVAATSCTVLPTAADGTPLSMFNEFARQPHAYIKLWKHHAAQGHAERLTVVARARGEAFLERYGGSISAEWFFPKVLEVLEEAPDVFDSAGRFVEAGDWIVWQLCGKEARSACQAGYKAMWDAEHGFPSRSFLAALNPAFTEITRRLSPDIRAVGSVAGLLTPEMASVTGLRAGTPVGVAIIDAHAAALGCGVSEPGKLVAILGPSGCYLLLDRRRHLIPGVAGVVKDGIVPGLYGYESGQAAVGDLLAWLARFLQRENLEDLAGAAAAMRPGAGGVMALDWWNGSRSPLMDAGLTGALFGLDLQTSAPGVYRALLEAVAFGARRIMDSFARGGLAVDEVYACGPLASTHPLLLQLFADISGKTVRAARSPHASALGAAILGAVAGGQSLPEAVKTMAGAAAEAYTPRREHAAAYQRGYERYERVAEYYGRFEGLLRELKKER
jgi:L-ribulokinase